MAVKKYWQPGTKRQRSGLRDYGRRNYGNPLFKNKARGGWSKRKRGKRSLGDWIPWRWILLSLLLLGIGCGIWHIIWSDSLKINNIVVNGADRESETWIRDSLNTYLSENSLLVFPNDNSLLFSVGEATNRISHAVYFENLTVRKKLPDQLTIEVKERPVVAVLATEDSFYAIGSEGRIIRKLTEGEIIRIDDLPPSLGAADAGELGAETVMVEVSDGESHDENSKVSRLPWPLLMLDERDQTRTQDAEPGNEVIPPSALNLIMAANEGLKDISGSEPEWFTVRPAAETVDVSMTGNWNIYFSTALSFQAQGKTLSLILKEKVKDKINELQYIDLRYNEKVFVRFNESKDVSSEDQKSNE